MIRFLICVTLPLVHGVSMGIMSHHEFFSSEEWPFSTHDIDDQPIDESSLQVDKLKELREGWKGLGSIIKDKSQSLKESLPMTRAE